MRRFLFFRRVLLKGSMGLVAAGLLLSQATAQSLKFESQHQDADAKISDTELKIVFPFKNEGDKPVRVINLESTCGCIEATSSRTVYDPGQEGEVVALFELGTFIGTHQKIVYMDTAAPDDTRYRLTVTVNIPEVVSIEPKVSKWAVGDPLEEKVIEVKFLAEQPLKITAIETTRPQFSFEKETIEEGRHYRVTLKPSSTEAPIMGALKFVTDSDIPKYQRALAFFSVTRSRGSRGGGTPIPAPGAAPDTTKSE